LVSKENPDGFRLGKTILQKELSASEVEELFTKGKTPLLNGFVSKRTKRAFSAHLTLDPETAKIGFEFAAKKAAKKGAKKAAKKAPKRD
ncbi:topoisomerase C-terminal repeat-containing protein, partial [Akkermansiaceae bacterium]|nr:topoisomerase C-terminal repeat-containing protein [Akkermansiaceae bacterium]